MSPPNSLMETLKKCQHDAAAMARRQRIATYVLEGQWALVGSELARLDKSDRETLLLEFSKKLSVVNSYDQCSNGYSSNSNNNTNTNTNNNNNHNNKPVQDSESDGFEVEYVPDDHRHNDDDDDDDDYSISSKSSFGWLPKPRSRMKKARRYSAPVRLQQRLLRPPIRRPTSPSNVGRYSRIKSPTPDNPFAGCPGTSLEDNHMVRVIDYEPRKKLRFRVELKKWGSIWLDARTVLNLEPKSALVEFLEDLGSKRPLTLYNMAERNNFIEQFCNENHIRLF